MMLPHAGWNPYNWKKQHCECVFRPLLYAVVENVCLSARKDVNVSYLCVQRAVMEILMLCVLFFLFLSEVK